jgi:D-alanyl-D-alanine carboxypeptidase
MKRIFLFIFISLIIFSYCSKKSTVEPEPNSQLPELPGTELQELVDGYIAENDNILGIACRVDKNKFQPWYGAVGYDDLSRTDSLSWNSKFFIGSVTKTLTSAIVLQLMEEKKVDLTHPIIEYLSNDAAAILAEIPYGSVITVNQALCHRSGLYDYMDNLEVWLLPDPARIYSQLDMLNIVKEMNKAESVPGTEFDYSNTNYLLLGLLIENITQSPYSAALDERIISPLGLENTFLFHGSAETDRDGIAHGYDNLGEDGRIYDIMEFSHSGWSGSAGGLISTTEDMNKFLTALTSGELFINSSTFNIMSNIGDNEWYALGLYVTTRTGLFYGHSGYFCGCVAFSFYYPEKEAAVSIFFSFNSSHGNIDLWTLLDSVVNNI